MADTCDCQPGRVGFEMTGGVRILRVYARVLRGCVKTLRGYVKILRGFIRTLKWCIRVLRGCIRILRTRVWIHYIPIHFPALPVDDARTNPPTVPVSNFADCCCHDDHHQHHHCHC